MSTRIYDAYLVRNTHGLRDVIELGKALKKVEFDSYRRHISDMAKAIFADKPEAEREDALHFFGCVCSDSVQSGHRVLNPESSFVIYPVPQGKTGGDTGLIESSLIVQFFGVGRDAKNVINETPWLVDVHFQNQSDRDDDTISATEWKSRELLWDEVFADIPIPSKVGAHVDIATKEEAFLAIWETVVSQIKEGTGKDPGDPYWAVCRGMADSWYSLVPKSMRAQWLGKKPLALDHYFPRIPAGCSVIIGKTDEGKLQVSFRDAEGVLIHADDSPNLTALEQVEALLDDYGVHGSTS